MRDPVTRLARLGQAASISIVGRFQSYGRNAFITLFARMLQNVNGLLLSVIVVRSFGLSAVGTLTVATIPTVILTTIGTFGLHYLFAGMDRPHAVRNSMGLAASFLSVLAAVPLAGLTAILLAKNSDEAITVFLLGLAGPFFAATNIANALLVLQARSSALIFSPLGNLVGLGLGFVFAKSFVGFALILAISRFVGVFAIFLFLPLSVFSMRELGSLIGRGLKFLTADILNLGSDQLAVTLASYLMSRADLGMFGLCRQMLTVSDTPGWSRLIALYPEIQADPTGRIPAMKREMIVLGLICGAGVSVLAVVIGLEIYRLPGFALLAPLLLASVPIRYLMGGLDMALRAIGAITATNRVTLLRALLMLAFVAAGTALWGAKGAILAMVIQVCCAAWLTDKVLVKQLSKTNLASAPRRAVAGRPTIEQSLPAASGS